MATNAQLERDRAALLSSRSPPEEVIEFTAPDAQELDFDNLNITPSTFQFEDGMSNTRFIGVSIYNE
jgi:hypothetical protein